MGTAPPIMPIVAVAIDRIINRFGDHHRRRLHHDGRAGRGHDDGSADRSGFHHHGSWTSNHNTRKRKTETDVDMNARLGRLRQSEDYC